MRLLFSSVLVVAALLCLSLAEAGEKGKAMKLVGKIACAKCDADVQKVTNATDCATVIVVADKDSKKDVIYYFSPDSNKKYHDDICTGSKEGTVEGTVTKQGEKRIIEVKKLTYK
jgi:hypothetical protein